MKMFEDREVKEGQNRGGLTLSSCREESGGRGLCLKAVTNVSLRDAVSQSSRFIANSHLMNERVFNSDGRYLHTALISCLN